MHLFPPHPCFSFDHHIFQLFDLDVNNETET